MAAEPGSSEGAAEVVAGVGQICKVELKLAATSIVHARRIPNSLHGVQAVRLACYLLVNAWLVAAGRMQGNYRENPSLPGQTQVK